MTHRRLILFSIIVTAALAGATWGLTGEVAGLHNFVCPCAEGGGFA